VIHLQQLTLTETIAKVEVLIDTGNRDVGRLQHIYDMIANEKPLYHSDQVYLETKLQSPIQDTNSISVESSKTKQMHQYTAPPKKEILKEQTKTSKIQGMMPKGWIPTTDSEELGTISKNILDEKQKLQQKQKISEEINLQRSKLTGLISNRKDYEQKITVERSSLEFQIKDERNKIETQTKYSKELIIQKDELM
jgi:hypothetical protein